MHASTLYSLLKSLDATRLRSIDPRVESIVVLRKLVRPYAVIDGVNIEYPIVFYIGARSDHIIVPLSYCSCKDFIIHVMLEKRGQSCIHLVAERLARLTNSFREIQVDIDSLIKIVEEILSYGRSPSLRKILYGKRAKKR